MSIKSRIYLTDVVNNKERKPTANEKYYAVYLVDFLGKHHELLFTEHDLLSARDRGSKNKEDFPPINFDIPEKKSVLSKLFFWR